MEVELTTSNLRKLCRVCLGIGDYNLWKYKVPWNKCATTESVDIQENPQDAEEITIYEVLQMYNDNQASILDYGNELPLICKICLDELQLQFSYYKRLQAANKQTRQLYEEALQHEQNISGHTEKIIIENVAFESALQDIIDITSDHSQSETHHTSPLLEVDSKRDEKSRLPSCISTTFAQKRKFVKNPKFILTGGVTQILSHATGSTSYVPSFEDVRHLTKVNMHCSPQKRKRIEEVESAPELITDRETNNDKYSEQLSDVITLENLKNNCINNYEQEPGDISQEDINNVSPNDIINVEYAINEQKLHDQFSVISHNEDNNQHIEEAVHQQQKTSIKNENDDIDSALSFSTLSADDAGRSIFVCKFCPQAFTAPCFLLTHARNSHICKYCKKAFRKTPDLFAHIKEVHKERKCSICGKELSSNANLRAHIKRMHRSKPYGEKSETTSKYERSVEEEHVYFDDTNHSLTVAYLD